MKNTLFAIILLTSFLFGQNEISHWSGRTPDYRIKVNHNSELKSDATGLQVKLVRGFQSLYHSLISDYDGNNCPFTPTCSAFFVEAVRETNLFQGALMFADRFTRDLNFIERNKYRRTENGRLIDLPENYELNRSKINFVLPKKSPGEK